MMDFILSIVTSYFGYKNHIEDTYSNVLGISPILGIVGTIGRFVSSSFGRNGLNWV